VVESELGKAIIEAENSGSANQRVAFPSSHSKGTIMVILISEFYIRYQEAGLSLS
jgi:hypothetical protein